MLYRLYIQLSQLDSPHGFMSYSSTSLYTYIQTFPPALPARFPGHSSRKLRFSTAVHGAARSQSQVVGLAPRSQSRAEPPPVHGVLRSDARIGAPGGGGGIVGSHKGRRL